MTPFDRSFRNLFTPQNFLLSFGQWCRFLKAKISQKFLGKTSYLLLFLLPTTLIWGAEYNRYLPHPPKPVQHSKEEHLPEITPPVSPMGTNNYDVNFEAGFLWWTANVTNLSYATKYAVVDVGSNAAPGTTSIQPERISEFDWEWSPGARTSFGVTTNYDGWDVTADWLYFHNSFNDSQGVHAPIPFRNQPIGTELLSNAWAPFSAVDSMVTRIVGEGGFQMNQVDLLVGRNFWLSPRLTLRPYGGARGHFSHLDFRSKKTLDGTSMNQEVGFAQWNDYQKQKFWSVGIVGGFDTSWNIYKALNIFGSGGMSLCYGPFKNRTHFRTILRSANRLQIVHETHTRRNHDQVWTLQQIIDLALGIRIQNQWINPKFHETFRLILDIGWEMHLYPSYNHLDQVTSDNATFGPGATINAPMTYRPAKGNLSLSGFILRGRCEF